MQVSIVYLNDISDTNSGISACTMKISVDNGIIIKDKIEMVKGERKRVEKALADLGFKAYTSQSNFIFFKGYDNLASDLSKKKILIRDYGGDLQGYFRLTIGSPGENSKVLEAIKEVLNEKGNN